MKKSRAIFLLITLVVVIGGYVAWAAWNPVPTIRSMSFHKNVDADARMGAEAHIRLHPLKVPEMTIERFLNRLANPYHPREDQTIGVWMSQYHDGAKILFINYPDNTVILARGLKDGRWSEENLLNEHEGITID